MRIVITRPSVITLVNVCSPISAYFFPVSELAKKKFLTLFSSKSFLVNKKIVSDDQQGKKLT
jgi:hypothetical protein